jgi:hypothetical protein
MSPWASQQLKAGVNAPGLAGVVPFPIVAPQGGAYRSGNGPANRAGSKILQGGAHARRTHPDRLDVLRP